jgi:hypothetical protein
VQVYPIDLNIGGLHSYCGYLMEFQVKGANPWWDVAPCDFSSSKQTTTNLAERLDKVHPAIWVSVYGRLSEVFELASGQRNSVTNCSNL